MNDESTWQKFVVAYELFYNLAEIELIKYMKENR